MPIPRLLLTGASLVAAACALLRGCATARTHDRLDAIAANALRAPETRRAVERIVDREADPAPARLSLARALLSEDLAAARLSIDAEASRLRLERAHDLAVEALAENPASGEALLLLGASTTLLRIRTGDTRLFSRASEWESALEASQERLPGSEEPSRFLAAADLEVWPALAPAKREKVEAMLREAFADEDTFDRLIEPWLKVSGSYERAVELLPDRPRTWLRLRDSAGATRDWTHWAAFDARLRAALRRDLAARIDAGARARGAGDFRAANEQLVEAAKEVSPDIDLMTFFEHVMANRPPGPAPEALARAAAEWLAWARPLCLVRDCPLSPATFDRLSSTAAAILAPNDGAFAAFAAGDIARAELAERRSEALWSEAWAPYLLLKAKWLAARNDFAAARVVLESIHRSYHSRLPFRLLAAKTGLATPGDTTPLRRSAWDATEWTWDRDTAHLELAPERAASGLAIALDGTPANGAVIELQWDGKNLEPIVLVPGAKDIRVAVDVAAEPHLLSFRARGDGRTAPGRLALIALPAATTPP